MTLANIGRSDLVLDLNARTGLLAFEAARRTPGVVFGRLRMIVNHLRHLNLWQNP